MPSIEPLPVHLVGSVPLADAETVFRTVAESLGPTVRRIPDGETGVRDNWVVWQLPVLEATAGVVGSDTEEYGPGRRIRPAPGQVPEDIVFGPLGYAQAALDSWEIFARLQDEGVIDRAARFQVSLPTPVAVVAAFVGSDHPVLERAYEKALSAELAEICATVPHERLAVQWDTAVEFAVFEGVFASWFGEDYETQLDAVMERLLRLGAAVPDAVELGYHLCYGDFGHRHFVEPADTSKLVDVAGRLGDGLTRRLDWIHLPVPRSRDDRAYYAPLAKLALPEPARLFLGLVHDTDGRRGAAARIRAAREFVTEFGIATECGLGRRAPERVPALLRLHADIAHTE
jgi:hypothetical protein